MKKLSLFACFILSSSIAMAGEASTKGAEIPMAETNVIGIGTEGLSYERWNGADSWGFGAEFLYGQWSGTIDNGGSYDWGFAINAMKRFEMNSGGELDMAFQIKPGAAFGEFEDFSLYELRLEGAVPMTYKLDGGDFNLLTGGAVPLTFSKFEDIDGFLSIPLFARLGIEMTSIMEATPWFLFEFGPNIAIPFAEGASTQTDFAFRLTAGASF